ncbi:MAG: hypothetical protein Q9161_006374 [Pseudevernia consocians]
MNIISFDKTIDPLMARNHTLAPSSDFDGSDAMLMELACEAFKSEGWPTAVQTGRYTFPLGDGVRNVAEE